MWRLAAVSATAVNHLGDAPGALAGQVDRDLHAPPDLRAHVGGGVHATSGAVQSAWRLENVVFGFTNDVLILNILFETCKTPWRAKKK